MIHIKDSNVSADSVFSVAPGEQSRPITMLTDKDFEEMWNPAKSPTCKFGIMAHREKNLLSVNTSTNSFWMLMAGSAKMS